MMPATHAQSNGPLLILIAVAAVLSACAPDREVDLWVPANAEIDSTAAPRSANNAEVVFSIAGTPAELSEALRTHYAHAGWRERSAADLFVWRQTMTGGVLRTPGQLNRPVVRWEGTWQDDAGDEVRYILTSDAESPAQPAAFVSAYGTYETTSR